MQTGEGHETAMIGAVGSDLERPEPPQDVSKGYRLVIGDELVTWEWPVNKGEAGGYYIEMKHPGVHEDEVTKAAAPEITADLKGKTGTVPMVGNSNAAFIAKCNYQITDFRLPIRIKQAGDDELKDATYAPANNGLNYPNERIYLAMLKMPPVTVNGEVRDLRSEIEAKLNEVAGRDIPAQRDLADLGEEPGS